MIEFFNLLGIFLSCDIFDILIDFFFFNNSKLFYYLAKEIVHFLIETQTNTNHNELYKNKKEFKFF